SSNTAYSLTTPVLFDDDRELRFSSSDLVAGDYRLLIHPGDITDRAGNAIAGDTVEIHLHVTYRSTLTSTVADADPNTERTQVFSGTHIPFTVSVDASIAVQKVELLANGVVAGTSNSAKPDFDLVA